MTGQDENKLETIRFRTTVKAKADFKEACARVGMEMSEVIENFIERFAKDPRGELVG